MHLHRSVIKSSGQMTDILKNSRMKIELWLFQQDSQKSINETTNYDFRDTKEEKMNRFGDYTFHFEIINLIINWSFI